MSNHIPDDFADIIETTHGSFGESLGQFEGVTDAVQPDGAAFEFMCQGCSRPVRLTLDYPELVALKFKMSPHIAFSPQRPSMSQMARGPASQFCGSPSQWKPETGKGEWRILNKCQHCQWNLRLVLKFNEPEALLKRARNEGYFPRDKEAAVTQHCQALLAQYQQSRQMRR